MRLWTIQSLEAWQTLQQRGSLRCQPEYIEADFAEAYNWLVAQARQRIGQPTGCQALLWAWCQWNNSQKRMPDLRYSLFPTDMKAVRLEIEIDESQVLLSDYELWHYVLNYWYLPESEEDGEAFEAELNKLGLSPYTTKPLPHSDYDGKIRSSWLRIFDMDWAAPGIASSRDEKSIQAVFWELTMPQVKKVKEFTAR